MGNKKHIIVAAVLAMLSTGLSPANAQDISLTQMDVKKSSVTDTVDVTFYTTGQSAGTVVTRKANNRYVVLLPNISSSSSVAPSLGGVKDLISDVEVKHVNDGIGGYTKITFSTTKPINIKTYTKRSNPVISAQKDYRNIIAQNNKPAETAKPQQAAQPKPSAQTVSKPTQQSTSAAQPQAKPVQAATAQQAKPKVETPVANKSVKTDVKAEKPAVQKDSAKSAQKPKLIPVDISKISKAVTQPKSEQVQPQKSVESKASTSSSDYVPKMKYDENGKRIIDLEPRVSHKIESESAQVENAQVQAETTALQNEENTPVQEVETTQKSHSIPLWMIILGGSALVLGSLFAVVRVLARDLRRRSLESFFSVSSPAKFTKPKEKYSDIVNNSNLNWQEKYKRYNAQQEMDEKVSNVSTDMSYVTNLGATKKAVITPKVQEVKPEISEAEKPISALFEKKSNKAPQLKNISENKVLKGNTEEFKKQMRAKIAQMEHSLAQTSLKAPEDSPGEVKSEDKSIVSKISDVKLKSFSKPMSLKEASRGLVNVEKKDKSYQEGRFVKLKDSALSVSRRQSASSEINASDLISKGNKYLKDNNGEMKMTRENENYLLSSLDEYLSILDSEKGSKFGTSVADSLSQIRANSEPMSRSGMSNPISRASNPISGRVSSPSVNGLIVKSGYNIDSEKGFYLVNMDGVSALVGRIKNNTYVLKKFDRVIDSQLQVRQDDANVYIVKVGRYKCLVDVSKDKMGTLIEI